MATGTQTTRLVIQLGDGASPETFAFTCGANDWTVSLKNNLGETQQFDCSDPLDTIVSVVRYAVSQDTTVSLSGTVTKEAWDTWRQWSDDQSIKNVKILLDEPLAVKGGSWTVPMTLETFEMKKQGAQVIDFTASLMGAGARVWTNAAS